MSKLPFYLEDPTPEYYKPGALPRVVLDIETTNIEFGDPWIEEKRIVVAAAMDRDDDIKLFGPEDFGGGTTTPQLLVAHNAKFELGWLHRAGVDIKNILVWDTMIAEYVLAGNRRVPLDLGSVCKRYGLPSKDPVVDALITGGVCPSEIPRKWIEDRVKRDVETTAKLYELQYARLAEEGLLGVMLTRCITTPVLALIEGEGMQLDAKRVEEETASQRLELVHLERELTAMTGGINMNSPKQLGEYLYDKLGFEELKNRRGQPIRTAAGGRMTDAATLAALKAKTPGQAEFIELKQEHAKASARLTKSLEFFSEICESHGGRFRGRFNQCVTQTHRLSASGRPIKCRDGSKRGVQFQNLPREYKKLFRAKHDDAVIVETDGAQLEFRVAGSLGRDPQVAQDVVSGADIHRYTASIMLGIPEEQVTDRQRTNAKPDTFGPLYGRTKGTKAQLSYIEAFRKKYSGVYKTQSSWVTEAMRTGKVKTITGLVFYFPGTTQDNSGYIKNSTNIFNYPIQSFATADIIPISLAYTFWESQGIAKIVNTVHDSVVAEVRAKDVDKYRQITINCWLDHTYHYLESVYDIKMFVPLGVGMKVSTHWGDTKVEEKFTKEHK